MSTLKRATLLALPLLIALGPATAVKAQSGLVAPSPISQERAGRVANAIGEPVDGWAVVRYSVLTDGTTSNVRVVETVPPSAAQEPIRLAAESWTFTPGTSNGQAIDWHNGESVVSFGSEASSEPSAEFESAYSAIVTLIEENLFTQALSASRTLVDEQATGRLELGLATAQLATINVFLENHHRALNYLKLVTDRRMPVLPIEDLFTALQIKLEAEMRLGRVREALATHEAIVSGLAPDAADPFAAVVAQLRQHWENTQFLEVSGQIIGNKPWRFDIGRRYFYFDNVNGEIDSIDVECDTRRLAIEFNPEADYQLPDSFGDCTIFVNGSDGTSFSYIAVLPQEE